MPTRPTPPARRAAALASLWFALSVLLWFVARGAFGVDDGPAGIWRSGPGNLAALLLTPARYVAQRVLDLSREPSFVVASAATAAAVLVTALVALRVYSRLMSLARRAPDPGRRVFVLRGAAAGAALLPSAAAAKATLVDPTDLRVARTTVTIGGLPPELDRLRIAHLSDWHVGSRVPLELLERATALALELEPDLIALTGDYIHARTGQLAAAERVLAPLTAPGTSTFGAVGVLGNHDFYDEPGAVRAMLAGLGVRMLDNRRAFLRRDGWTDDPRDALCVAGLADKWMDTPRPSETLSGVPASTPRVVLAHQPDTAELPSCAGPAAPRIDLMLCGHTHGGQVRLPLIGTPVVPSDYGQKYAGGLVRGPRCPVLVSRGIGMSVLPVRWGVPPEIGLVTLRAPR